jgi:Tol biopolymer transport system component
MFSRLGTVCALLLALLVLALALPGCDFSEEEQTFPPPPPRGAPGPFRVDQTPAWSPDGRYIAYHHDAGWTEDSTDVSGLYILDLETDATRLVVEGSAWSPDWRPDGARIAFTTGNVYTVRPDGSDLQQVTGFGASFFPRWSPDGRTLTFSRSGTQEEVGIWFGHLADSTFTKFGFGAAPADWSPGGDRVVYDKTQIFVADTSRVDSTQLTSNDAVDNRYQAWSPDGQWIAWSPLDETGFELWVMRADGTEQQKLADGGSFPAWGPDSERIVFAKPAQGSDLTALWTIRRDGTDLQQVTDPSRNPLN